MKTTIHKVLGIAAFIFFLFSAFSSAQITSTQSSNDTRTREVAKAEDDINKLLLEARIPFNEGLLAYQDTRRSDAGAKFDRSVEVFLYSTLNIQREQRLQTCYN